MNQRAFPGFVFVVVALWGVLAWPQTGGQGGTRTAQIHGQVRLSNDQPAPMGMLVSLELREGGTVVQTQTDRRGRFEFTMLTPGQYEVYIRAPGYQVEPQLADLTSIPTAYLNFVLRAEHETSPVPPEGPGATISALDPNAPEEARKSLESGRVLLDQGKDLDKSIEFFKKAIEQYASYSEAYFLLGVAYSTQGKWDEAEKALSKSLDLNQKNPAAYLSLGSVENEKKSYPDAEKYLLKAVELSPESPDAQFELGRAYWGLTRWDAADLHVSKANQLRPDNAGQHVLLGNIKLRERDAEGALKEFKESLRIDPKGPLAEPTRQMVDRIEQALNAQK
ncbi:MAG TPA: tetratricopeptide repeat protein [Terriglobales bacterium]